MPKFRLEEILTEQHMTKTKLSELTGISRNSLSQLAHGHSNGINFKTLYQISKALDVSIGELFEQERYQEIYDKAKKYDAIKSITKE